MPNMNYPRFGPGVFIYGDMLYAFGGNSNSIEKT